MQIIISPAKKMRVDTDSLGWESLPAFLPDTEELLQILRGMTYEELKALWRCNDSIAAQNAERLAVMDLRRNLTPAILAYEGIQYRYMAPGVFTHEALGYIGEHLRIVSGFYGLLRPFDGVTPYRLEMQAKLKTARGKDLYAFWGSRLAEELTAETDLVVNLASREYSVGIEKHLPSTVRMITCVFGEEQQGKIIEKGTMCKMARGEMVRFLAEHQITDVEDIKSFDGLQYRFYREDENTLVFLRQSQS